MRPSIRNTIMASVAAVGVLALVEVGIRVAGSVLPEPVLWPSLEADIKVEQMSEPANRPSQVVFLGDSTMEAGVDPSGLSTLGVAASSYNAALPWSTPLSMDLWFREVVGPLLEPEVVYVGLVPPSAVTGHEEDVLYQGLLTALKSREQSLVDGIVGWSELYRRRTLIRDLPVVFRRERVLDLQLISPSGFQAGYLRGEIAANPGESPAIDRQKNPLSDDHEAALERLIQAAAQSGVEVVLVVEPLPCPGDGIDCVSRFLGSSFYRNLQDFAETEGVRLLNAMNERWTEDLFVDDRHLNTEGVDRFQRLVADSISALTSS